MKRAPKLQHGVLSLNDGHGLSVDVMGDVVTIFLYRDPSKEEDAQSVYDTGLPARFVVDSLEITFHPETGEKPTVVQSTQIHEPTL